MKRTWAGKVVAVTGSSRGIGREIARTFAAKGALVVLNGRNAERLEATVREFRSEGLDARGVVADMADPDGARALAAAADAEGGLDVFVANAGVAVRGLFEELGDAAIEQSVRTNVLGTLFAVRAAWPALLRNRGRLALVSTQATFRGLPGVAAYSATKSPMSALAEALSLEGRSRGASASVIYVGRAQDDPDKTTLAADGSLVPLKKTYSQSQAFVAAAVEKAVRRRRLKTVPSFGGKAYAFLSGRLPRFTGAVMSLARKKLISEAQGGIPE